MKDKYGDYRIMYFDEELGQHISLPFSSKGTYCYKHFMDIIRREQKDCILVKVIIEQRDGVIQ